MTLQEILRFESLFQNGKKIKVIKAASVSLVEAVAACGDETWRHLNEPCGQSCQDYIQNNQSRMRPCMTYAEANGYAMGGMRSWITRCQ